MVERGWVEGGRGGGAHGRDTDGQRQDPVKGPASKKCLACRVCNCCTLLPPPSFPWQVLDDAAGRVESAIAGAKVACFGFFGRSEGSPERRARPGLRYTVYRSGQERKRAYPPSPPRLRSVFASRLPSSLNDVDEQPSEEKGFPPPHLPLQPTLPTYPQPTPLNLPP